jgi:hypothetical protein
MGFFDDIHPMADQRPTYRLAHSFHFEEEASAPIAVIARAAPVNQAIEAALRSHQRQSKNEIKGIADLLCDGRFFNRHNSFHR